MKGTTTLAFKVSFIVLTVLKSFNSCTLYYSMMVVWSSLWIVELLRDLISVCLELRTKIICKLQKSYSQIFVHSFPECPKSYRDQPISVGYHGWRRCGLSVLGERFGPSVPPV